MILLCNGDSWTQGDSPAQTFNWEAKPNLDWYDIIPNFGEPTCPTDDRITYKFYDSDVWPKVLGNELGWETWNCGRNGASNDRIVRSTIHSVEYLESLGDIIENEIISSNNTIYKNSTVEQINCLSANNLKVTIKKNNNVLEDIYTNNIF